MQRAILLAFLLTGVVTAQIATPSTPQMRFVDWHAELDRPGLTVVVGKLGKIKEGKRERLLDGKLGGGTSVSAVSGTQYFKVPASCQLQPRTVLAGAADPKEKLKLEFELQLARLPDGNEQRQTRTADASALTEDTLALFVVAPSRDKKAKGLELLHAIPFDAKADAGPDPELRFLDTMRDFQVVNQRTFDLERALAALDTAQGAAPAAAQRAEAIAAARKRLQELLDAKVELRLPANDALLTQHVGPLEQRARQKLADAGSGG